MFYKKAIYDDRYFWSTVQTCGELTNAVPYSAAQVVSLSRRTHGREGSPTQTFPQTKKSCFTCLGSLRPSRFTFLIPLTCRPHGIRINVDVASVHDVTQKKYEKDIATAILCRNCHVPLKKFLQPLCFIFHRAVKKNCA